MPVFVSESGRRLRASAGSMIERELRSNPEWTEIGAPARPEQEAPAPAPSDEFSSLRREELNALASEKGVESPEDLGSKAEVIAAIRAQEA